MEKRNGFNVGDIVRIDWGVAENSYMKSIAEAGDMNDITFTITRTFIDEFGDPMVDLDSPLFKVNRTGEGWLASRFKLCKNEIISQILSEL